MTMDELLSADLPPAQFLPAARYAVAMRRNEISDRSPEAQPPAAAAWNELHAVLLKGIYDELVKARKGIRT